MRIAIAFFGSAALCLGCAQEAVHAAPPRPAFDLDSYVLGRKACLVVTTARGESMIRTDGARCAERFSPASTFKIPNSIIGLETGVLTDANSVVPWDRDKYPQQDWWPEVWTDRQHDLRSAFRHSFVPFYRALATQIGREPMQRYVIQLNYGSRQIEGSLDSFWLDGGIAISADEQVTFLRKFYQGKLGASSRTTAIVKDILVRERRGGRVLSVKTGTGDGPNGTAIGWLVGYVEEGSDVHFFAFNVSGKTFDDIPGTWREETLLRMLVDLQLWK